MPYETIFRWNRGTITRLDDHDVELEITDKRLVARRANTLDAVTQVGDEAVIGAGFNDQNREVIDVVVDGYPPLMSIGCALNGSQSARMHGSVPMNKL